jgi:Carboxypeptidase regulatory-like domain
MTRSRIWQALSGITLAAALVCGTAAAAAAQETTGTITGVAKDQTGAVLPGVAVAVKNVQTGATANLVTNESGLYTAPLLQPGEYEVTFTLSGFQSRTIKGIQLHVNDRLEVNGQMGVSGVSENVQVSAASQFVQPSPQVQTLMGPTQVQELPLNNRSFVELSTLVPGVSSDLPDEVNLGLTNAVSISINGGRRNSVNWLVDGVANVDVGSNITLLNTPTLESIQEFKIITSSYAAEWPRSGGGVINVVTRGGTQKFAGTAYDFFRNDQLNANSFFRNRSTDLTQHVAPRLRYNNPGFSAGGPLLPSRQKAFFFFSEEVRRITRAPASQLANVVNPAWLNDPTNANYVDPSQRDPNAVKLLALWPAPNQFSSTGTAQFNGSVPSVNNTRQEVVRIDYDWKQNTKIVGRYTHDLTQTVEPGGLFTGTVVPHVSATHTDAPGQIGAFELRSNWGTKLNELKYQFSSNYIHTADDSKNVNTRTQIPVTIPELFPENAGNRLPSIAITGSLPSGFTTIQLYKDKFYNNTVADNVTWTSGKHAFKFGGIAAFEAKNENANNNTQGSFTFGTGGGRTAFQNFLTGNRDGLCGSACSYSETETDVTNHLRWQRWEMFAQDTYRVRPAITLDYGVRYALYPSVKDKNNVLATFDPSAYSLAKAPTCANAACTALVAGTGDITNGTIVAGKNSPFGRGIYPTQKGNIQPRVGVSWDPFGSGTTIVRSGYGLYYDEPLIGIFEQNAFLTPAFVKNTTLQNASLSNPTAGLAPGTIGLVGTQDASSVPFKTPRTQQWNVGMQRQLYRRGAIDVGYVGSHGDDLIQQVDINQPQPQDVVNEIAAGRGINTARPYLGYTSIIMRQTTAYSNYHGLLTQFRHEGGRAGTYTLNYTLSRNRTTASNDRDSVDQPQNPNNLKAEYADARTDRRHIFNATYIYELPFFMHDKNELLKAALGGWQISGFTTLQSGPPVPRILVSTNGGRRGNQATETGTPTVLNQGLVWFDASVFKPNADGTYGNSGRAMLRLPGRNQTDLALSKNFYPMSKRVQFRADFINAFNHTQWTTVNADCSTPTDPTVTCASFANSTVGQITGTRNPREVQLSLKLYW